jgi:hypothetical protein
LTIAVVATSLWLAGLSPAVGFVIGVVFILATLTFRG